MYFDRFFTKSSMRKNHFFLLYMIAIILISSGLLKIFDFSHFIKIISAYNFIPRFLIMDSAISIIIIELFLGITLFFKRYQKYSLFCILILFSFFLILTIYSRVNDIKISCGCFGKFSQQIGSIQHFIVIFSLFSFSCFEYSLINSKKFNTKEDLAS